MPNLLQKRTKLQEHTECALLPLVYDVVRTEATVRHANGGMQVEGKLRNCGFLMLLKPKFLHIY